MDIPTLVPMSIFFMEQYTKQTSTWKPRSFIIILLYCFLQLNAQAKIATESLKRHHVLDNENIEVASKRPLKENLFVPQRYVVIYIGN